MKNKILSKAYGGVTEARRKLNGLGLPRQWKVITSTLLLLFTFAIGNVLAADPEVVTYTFTNTSCLADQTYTSYGTPGSETFGYASSIPVVDTNGKNALTLTGAIYNNNNSTGRKIKYDSSKGLSLERPGAIYFTLPKAATSITINIKSKAAGFGAAGEAYNAVTTSNLLTCSGDELGAAGSSGGTFTANNVPAGNYKIYSKQALSGSSSWGIVSIVITYPAATCTKPGTPSSLAVDSKTYNSASFSWSAAANSDGYKVYVEKKSDKSKILDWTTCATISYTATGLAAETEYTFKVKAIGASGYCELGDEATVDVTTEAAPSACPEGLSISGTKDYTEGQTISLTAALETGNGEITYNWYKGADLATAKAAGSIGTGTSFSKASCTTSDAGNYFCVATKATCSDAESTAYAVTVAEKTCPTSGVVYTMTMKSKSLSGVTQNTEVALVAGDYATEEGGVSYIGNKNSDAGKAQIKTDGGGIVYFNGNDAYVKIVLDCPLKADDKITFVPGSGTRQVCFTTTNTRTDTYQTSSNTFTVSSAFLATAADPENVTTLYVWRIGSSTYLHSLTITRPYNITFESAYGVTPTSTKGFEVTLAEITGVASWEHTGWTANKDVKVGDDTKTAGTALDVDATVKVSADTKFTATWVPFSVKHTVTYYDGEAIPANKLGEEEITEGDNPTGAGLAPKKHGYTFGGWSLTNGGAAQALSGITVNEDKNLFVVWTPVVCPTSGVIFSAIADPAKAPGSDYQIAGNTRADLATYATISGGSAVFGNADANQYITIKSSTSKIALSGSNMRGYVKVTMDCDLEEGDIIRIADNSNKFRLAFDSTGTVKNDVSSGNHDVLIDADRKGKYEFFIYRNGNDVNFGSIQVLRPYTVSFNMNGQSATAIADQKVVEGGKVTKPTDPVVEGQAFGGWFTDAACTEGKEWAFATATVSQDTTLYAKWTALKSMTLVANGSGEDDVVSYPTVGDPVAVPACPFTYSGYIFAGWTYSPSVTVEDGSFNMPNEDLTLTAQWVDASSVARIGSNYYATLADALDHAADGEIVLLQDINVEAQVEIADGVTATIDLAGHKIEYTNATTLPSGVILVHNGGSLTINDSSDPDAGSIVSGDNAYAAIALTKAGDNAANPAVLVINGGTLTGYYYGITGNGSRPNTQITINGGAINATATNDNLGIYHPQNGTLTVTGGTITGYASAIEMRAGTLVIEGGTFTATATEFSCNPNGSGTTTQGAAIAIAQHTTKKDIEVTINGGTFTGVKALNESNPQANDPAPQVTMAVTAGTFTGEVSTVDVNNFVSGGSFSEPVAEANCATDYYPATKPNGKYGVAYAAESIDFIAVGNDYMAQLGAKHYDLDINDNDHISYDNNSNPYDKGLKIKEDGAAISFSVEPGKVVEITTGVISGATISANGVEEDITNAAKAESTIKTRSYYSDDAQAFLITMTTSAYNIFKSINIRDPYQVTLDATTNGGEAVAPMYGKLSVTLPSATKGTDHFIGWYDKAAEEGSTLVGLADAEFTPTSDTTLYAHYAAQSNDATLASWEIDGVDTPVPTDPLNLIHRINVPYGTAVDDLPKITAAVAHDATYAQSVEIYPAAGPEWQAGVDGGCYVQQVIVTAEDGTQGFYHVRTKILPKDMLLMIKATHDGTAQGATIEGYFGGTKDKNTANNGKLGVANQYLGIKLAEEAGTFKAGDVLKIYATNPSAAVRIYSDKGTTRINATDGTFDSEKMFTYTLTDDEEWIYLYRRTDGESDMNPTLGYMAVYRAYPNPLVNTITFNGAAGTVDNDLKTITVEVPASTDLATMPVDATFLSNDPSQTNGAVTGGTWAEGDNEYIVTDKDGDKTTYTVTISIAVPSNDATLSALSYGGTAIALADGVYEYDVELPYGTSNVPALAATAHHAGATIESIDDAAAFVDRKATSTVTVKAEDDATVQVYKVNFTVDRYETTILWDGSTMDELSDITAMDVATADISVEGKSVSFEGKNYTKALNFSGNTKSTRYFGINVPVGKVAKVSIVYRSRGNSARSIIIGTAIASAIDESAIVYATKENDTELLYKLTADIFAAGTIYINTTNGFQVFEIDVQLADGYARSAMLGAGVYGTVCVPNNVAVEDIQGVTVYELMGREPEYGKLAFDEIVSGELEAGVPYVFQAHGNHMAMLYGETHVANPVDKHNGMYGTFEQIVLTELDDVYYFAQKALWSCEGAEDLTIAANRAYVKLGEIDYLTPNQQNPAPGRRRVMMAVNGEKIATGMENLNASDKPVKMIINGQLFILRGEKMYDAKGQLVK